MQDDLHSVHASTTHGSLVYKPKLLRANLQAPATLLHLSPSPRGSLGSLLPKPLPSVKPGPGQVLLHVDAVGLNFRDVLNVLGMYPGNPGEPGSDVSGIVAALGPGTQSLHRCLAQDLLWLRSAIALYNCPPVSRRVHAACALACMAGHVIEPGSTDGMCMAGAS